MKYPVLPRKFRYKDLSGRYKILDLRDRNILNAFKGQMSFSYKHLDILDSLTLLKNVTVWQVWKSDYFDLFNLHTCMITTQTVSVK